jgi:hypothetical protein
MEYAPERIEVMQEIQELKEHIAQARAAAPEP